MGAQGGIACPGRSIRTVARPPVHHRTGRPVVHDHVPRLRLVRRFGVVEACDDPAVSLNQLPFDHRRIVERERRSRRPGLRPMHAWVRDAGVPTKAAAAAITAPGTADRPAPSRQRRSYHGDRHASPDAATQLHPPRVVAPQSGRSTNTPRAAATAPGDGRSARSDRRRTRPPRALGARVEGRTDSSATPHTAHRARRRHFHRVRTRRSHVRSASPISRKAARVIFFV
jgi:hypothetical protein